MDWRSNAAVDTLTKYVHMRVPYPDIAKRMGTTTGAICGKVHRLGIGKGPRNPDRLYLRATKPAKAQMVPDAAYFEIMERQEEEAEARQGLTVMLDTSEDHHCRYIIGDPTKRQMCGARRHAGTPYCEEHAALCLSTISLESRHAMGKNKHQHPAMYLRSIYPSTGAGERVAVDYRTFEEADAPEPVTTAA